MMYSIISFNMSTSRAVRLLKSKKEATRNWIIPVSNNPKQVFEARYVRRPGKISAYVSSAAGCFRRCKMCYLTDQEQFGGRQATKNDYIEQMKTIMLHHRGCRDLESKKCNVNLMARADALDNIHFRKDYDEIYDQWKKSVQEAGLDKMQVNVSSIIPRNITCIPKFKGNTVFYYSMYSVDPSFRRKWLPQAKEVHEALKLVQRWQQSMSKPVVIHGAFIAGENDSEKDVREMCETVKVKHGIQARFNIVRYNPPPSLQGKSKECEHLEELRIWIKDYMPCKVIPRVDPQVYASCGMFVNQ